MRVNPLALQNTSSNLLEGQCKERKTILVYLNGLKQNDSSFIVKSYSSPIQNVQKVRNYVTG